MPWGWFFGSLASFRWVNCVFLFSWVGLLGQGGAALDRGARRVKAHPSRHFLIAHPPPIGVRVPLTSSAPPCPFRHPPQRTGWTNAYILPAVTPSCKATYGHSPKKFNRPRNQAPMKKTQNMSREPTKKRHVRGTQSHLSTCGGGKPKT